MPNSEWFFDLASSALEVDGSQMLQESQESLGAFCSSLDQLAEEIGAEEKSVTVESSTRGLRFCMDALSFEFQDGRNNSFYSMITDYIIDSISMYAVSEDVVRIEFRLEGAW